MSLAVGRNCPTRRARATSIGGMFWLFTPLVTERTSTRGGSPSGQSVNLERVCQATF